MIFLAGDGLQGRAKLQGFNPWTKNAYDLQ